MSNPQQDPDMFLAAKRTFLRLMSAKPDRYIPHFLSSRRQNPSWRKNANQQTVKLKTFHSARTRVWKQEPRPALGCLFFYCLRSNFQYKNEWRKKHSHIFLNEQIIQLFPSDTWCYSIKNFIFLTFCTQVTKLLSSRAWCLSDSLPVYNHYIRKWTKIHVTKHHWHERWLVQTLIRKRRGKNSSQH